MIEDAAAAIIAGGRATRLAGVSKALIEADGQAIVDRQLEVLRPLFPEIVAVTFEPGPFAVRGIRCVGDEIQGKGPPGGLHAALRATARPWVFAVACDMPFLAAPPIELLASLRGGWDAVIPDRGGWPEPLHGFYSLACVAPFEEALHAGNPSLSQLVRRVPWRRVGEAELRVADPDLRCLENANGDGDLARLGLRWPTSERR